MAATDAQHSLMRWTFAVLILIGFGIGMARADDTTPMSKSDEDFVRQQIIPCWNFDIGITHPENYTVAVALDVAPDGRITSAKVLDEARFSDPTYRSVAEGALRAVENPQCVPLRFPPGKYWPHITVIFDLSKAINGEE